MAPYLEFEALFIVFFSEIRSTVFLGPPVVPFYQLSLGRFGSPSKINHREKVLTSLLEDSFFQGTPSLVGVIFRVCRGVLERRIPGKWGKVSLECRLFFSPAESESFGSVSAQTWFGGGFRRFQDLQPHGHLGITVTNLRTKAPWGVGRFC